MSKMWYLNKNSFISGNKRYILWNMIYCNSRWSSFFLISYMPTDVKNSRCYSRFAGMTQNFTIATGTRTSLLVSMLWLMLLKRMHIYVKSGQVIIKHYVRFNLKLEPQGALIAHLSTMSTFVISKINVWKILLWNGTKPTTLHPTCF